MCAGDVSSGKSTLVDQMCRLTNSSSLGGKFPLSGCSLEYRFIDVQDEETDGEWASHIGGCGTSIGL